MDERVEKESNQANDKASVNNVSSAGSIAKSSATGVVSQILYLTTRFLLTPFVLAKIGLEAYGFWSILFVALGWFGLHRMGFTSAAISYIARYRASGQNDRINDVLTTTATLGLLLCVAMGGTLIFFADKIVYVLGTTPELFTEAVFSFQITVLATFAALVLGGYQSTLEALQQYPRVKVIDAAALMLEACLIIAFLAIGGGLGELSVAYAIRMVAPIPVYAYYARREIPGLNALPGRLDRSITSQIFRFGGSIQLLGIVHLATTSLERLPLAHLVGLAAAGSYELGRKLVTLAAALPTHALAPLVPAAADLGGRAGSEGAKLEGLLRTMTRAAGIAQAGASALLLALALPKLGVHRRYMARDIVGPAVMALAWAAICLFLTTGDVAGASRAMLIAEVVLSAAFVGLGATATSFILVLDPVEQEAIESLVRKIVSRPANTITAEASSA